MQTVWFPYVNLKTYMSASLREMEEYLDFTDLPWNGASGDNLSIAIYNKLSPHICTVMTSYNGHITGKKK